MPRGRRAKDSGKDIEQYKHLGAVRVNNPPVGLVSPENDPVEPVRVYEFDPHLDPQLVWAGKAERTSFDVDTVSLHVHERIDPRTIIEAVRKQRPQQQGLESFFSSAGENPPYRDAIEFYRHKHGWSNRLVAGDSLLVMNSLLQKEGMAGNVQMIYIDPPYGIKYGSNFQPFVGKRDVKDGKDEDLTQEPEMIKAFRDTWELGIHSYLSYLRDRLLLARKLLTESGSVFVQISDENIHHVREIMDEVFDSKNFISIITVRKSGSQTSKWIPVTSNYLIWYSKNKEGIKYHQLFLPKDPSLTNEYNQVQLENGEIRTLMKEEKMNPSLIPIGAKICKSTDLQSRTGSDTTREEFTFKGIKYKPRLGAGWRTSISGLEKLSEQGRLIPEKTALRYLQYLDDTPGSYLNNIWYDLMGETDRIYVVQTAVKIVERCMLMTTDPGDLILDPTCGSGTTAFVAEQWGRRWITCDTSRVAIALAKQRLMTASYDYYELRNPKEGVQGSFNYKTVPHITLKSIANNEPPETVELYDQPKVDNNKFRVTGPFTDEAVPALYVIPVGEAPPPQEADASIARSGETRRQGDWRSELLKTGIRAKGGQIIQFIRVETLKGAKWLHAEAETKEAEPKRVVVSFGPDYAPLEQKQVDRALEEASHLYPKPKMVVFAAFQFDPEAAKDIDEAKTGMTLLKAQMNTDLLTKDLKKKQSGSQSFWLIGQPDITVEKLESGPDAGKTIVTVNGFDYYDPRTDEVKSGGPANIAVWMLDPDYDGRSLFPRQVFFPMTDSDKGWAKLARNLKAEIDSDLIEQYHGNQSLPFTPGDSIALKIVDDRGIESLKIIRVS